MHPSIRKVLWNSNIPVWKTIYVERSLLFFTGNILRDNKLLNLIIFADTNVDMFLPFLHTHFHRIKMMDHKANFPFPKACFPSMLIVLPSHLIPQNADCKKNDDEWQLTISQSTKVLTHHENCPIKTISTSTNNHFCGLRVWNCLDTPVIMAKPRSLVADSNIHHRFERCVCTSNFCWWIYHQKSPIRLLRAPF